MRRWRAVAVAAVLGAGCASYYDKITPSGTPCRDMPLVPFGKDEQLAGRPFTRLRPVSSSLRCETQGERMESLRRQACDVMADAVIDIAQDEVITSTRRT